MTTPTRGSARKLLPTDLLDEALRRLPSADCVAVACHVGRIRATLAEFNGGQGPIAPALKPFAAAAIAPLIHQLVAVAKDRYEVLGPQLGAPWASVVASVDAINCKLQGKSEEATAALEKGWGFLIQGVA